MPQTGTSAVAAASSSAFSASSSSSSSASRQNAPPAIPFPRSILLQHQINLDGPSRGMDDARGSHGGSAAAATGQKKARRGRRRFDTMPFSILLEIAIHLPLQGLRTLALTSRRLHRVVYDERLWQDKLNKLHITKAADLYVAQSSWYIAICAKEQAEEEKALGKWNEALQISPGKHERLSSHTSSAGGGSARQEFIDAYLLLAPFYSSYRKHRRDALVFSPYHEKVFPAPPNARSNVVMQAKTLYHLRQMALYVAVTDDWQIIGRHIQASLDLLASSLLSDFESTLERQDNDVATLRDIAEASRTLGDARSVLDLWISRHLIFDFTSSYRRHSSSATSSHYVKLLGEDCIAGCADALRIFHPEVGAVVAFLVQVDEELLRSYLQTTTDKSKSWRQHDRIIEVASLAQELYFIAESVSGLNWPEHQSAKLMTELVPILMVSLLPYLNGYFVEELEWLKKQLYSLCERWTLVLESKTQEGKASVFANSSNPKAVKADFVSTFKRGLMLPVTIGSKAVAMTIDGLGVGFASLRMGKIASLQATPNLSRPTSNQDLHADLPAPAGSKTPDIIDASTMGAPISLEVALGIFHASRESIRRLIVFATPYLPNTCVVARQKIQEVTVAMLQVLNDFHLRPGYQKAIDSMSMEVFESKQDEHDDLFALQTFLEVVHVGDTIQQMVAIFFSEELKDFVDLADYSDPSCREKKNVEQCLDQAVATGLEKYLDTLVEMVSRGLRKNQDHGDFMPVSGANPDLRPTLACQTAVRTLERQIQLVRRAVDKQILSVFLVELGTRLFNILCRHVKLYEISSAGAIQLLADMSAYQTLIEDFREPELVPLYSVLKQIPNVYLITDPTELGQLVRDLSRFALVLRPEEVVEFCHNRSDWRQIEAAVEKVIYGWSMKEDCNVA